MGSRTGVIKGGYLEFRLRLICARSPRSLTLHTPNLRSYTLAIKNLLGPLNLSSYSSLNFKAEDLAWVSTPDDEEAIKLLTGSYIAVYVGGMIGVAEGDTRSLDYGSC